ncbi:MAG: pseudouridine synthase [Polyangiaceae bacterium]
MIPHSEAVEALCLLTPREPPRARVLFQDEQLIAVEKSAYAPITPQGSHERSLLDSVRKLDGAAQAVAVRPLELVSGVCLFARTQAAAPAISEAWAEAPKQYVALVQGITHKRGRIERTIREGKALLPALTRYERERVVGTHSLLRVSPETSRAQQIQRHFAQIRHPVLGDARHGNPAANRHFEERYGLDRPFLHLERVELQLGAQRVALESALPAELAAVLTNLGSAHDARSVEPQKPAPRRQ